MAQYDYDLIVIGSGAAGSIAAHQYASTGRSVAIIEKDQPGGECPRIADIPLKALLHSAKIYEQSKRSEQYGIRGPVIGYNYPTVKRWKDTAVRRTGQDRGESSYTNKGIVYVKGDAYFLDPHTISIGVARLSAANFLIATGSEPEAPDVPGLKKAGYLNYDQAIELTKQPKSVLIIGGSPTGCEFAQLFASFGSAVHIVDQGEHLLPDEDKEVGEFLADNFDKKYGAKSYTAKTVVSVEAFGQKKRVRIAPNDKLTHIKELIVEEIIVATAKKPRLDIGLENAGVQYTEHAIITNSQMQTSAPHIYAAGDCTGIFNLTNGSIYQAKVAISHLNNRRTKLTVDYSSVPRCIFTNPEIAATGATEAELKHAKVDYVKASSPLTIVGRSHTTDSSDGFVKVLVAKKTAEILGASIVAPAASEMIHQINLAMHGNLNAANVASMVYAFPSWSEAIRVACHQAAEKALK